MCAGAARAQSCSHPSHGSRQSARRIHPFYVSFNSNGEKRFAQGVPRFTLSRAGRYCCGYPICSTILPDLCGTPASMRCAWRASKSGRSVGKGYWTVKGQARFGHLLQKT